MKSLVVVLLVVCFWGLNTVVFSQDDRAYIKALEYLEEKGEVYFSFTCNSVKEINRLTEIISIDNVVGKTIYAYANRKEFNTFLKNGFPYTVLIHPGDVLINPNMSDYNNKMQRQWDTYPTYDGYLSLMNQFAEDYPELCTIIDIGESVMGRKLLVAKISDNVTADEKEPKFFNTATIHGDETVGLMLMLRMMDYLLSNYSTDERVTRIVDSIEMYISPLSNPDGTYRNDNSTVQGATRGNANGTDLNRNYPDPVSGMNEDKWEKETRAYIEFEKKHQFVMSSDLHGGVKVVCYPWGCKWDHIIADDTWYVFVSQEYADNVKANSPGDYFDFNADGIINGVDWYAIEGGRMSYLPYFRKCRVITLELSYPKLLPESQLNVHWDYNKEALLSYFEQVLNGIRGTVTDSITNEPVQAKIFISGHDKDSSEVYSDSTHGDYYRPIFEGTYDVTFTSKDYISKTIPGVKVNNNAATVLDVKLRPENMGNIYSSDNSASIISIMSHNRGVTISWESGHSIVEAAIFDLNGRRIKALHSHVTTGKNRITWGGLNNKGNQVGSGCYILQIKTADKYWSQQFVYSR